MTLPNLRLVVTRMRRITGGVLVAFLTFITGLFLFTTWYGNGPSRHAVAEPRTLAETEITKTIFRYNIQQFFADAESPTYFLSEHVNRDASEDVILSLQREGLRVRRLSQLGMNHGAHLDCYYCPKGPSEFILRVGKIRWLNDHEVLVGSSSRRWSLNADRAYLFRVVLEGDRWVIKEHELL